MKLLYDVTENKWYDANGTSFPGDQPQIPYGNTERVEIQLLSHVGETNLYNEEIVPYIHGSMTDGDTEGWEKFTGYSGISGLGAVLATDNNFLHLFKGTLKTAVSSGSLSENSTITIQTSASIDDIQESGNIILRNSSGENAISYKSRAATDNGIVFTLASGNTASRAYAVNDDADMPEAMYALVEMNTTLSDAAVGKFVFDFICNSTKLRNRMQYSNIQILDDCKGLELTVFSTNSNVVTIMNRFLCSTFRITGGIADLGTGQPVSNPQESAIQALIAANMDGITIGSVTIQYATASTVTAQTTWSNYSDVSDFSEVKWFRLKIGSGSTWSEAIPLNTSSLVLPTWEEP